MRIHYIKRAALSLCAAMSLGLSATSQVSQSVTNTQNAQAEPLTPPYSETFADESFLESYTIIDSNQDRTKWEPYLGSAQISYNSELDMDDWLITPALNLEGGKMYSFSIEIMTGGSFNETFEVMFGKDKNTRSSGQPHYRKNFDSTYGLQGLHRDNLSGRKWHVLRWNSRLQPKRHAEPKC